MTKLLNVPATEQALVRYAALTHYMHTNSRINKVWIGGKGYSFRYDDDVDILEVDDELTREKTSWSFVCPIEWKAMNVVCVTMTADEFATAFNLFVNEFSSMENCNA